MNYEWITLKCVFPYYLKMLYDTSLLLFSLQIKYCMANNKSSKLVNIVLTTCISGRMKLRVTRTVDDEEGFWGWNKTANGRTWHSIQEWMLITYSQLHHQEKFFNIVCDSLLNTVLLLTAAFKSAWSPQCW